MSADSVSLALILQMSPPERVEFWIADSNWNVLEKSVNEYKKIELTLECLISLNVRKWYPKILRLKYYFIHLSHPITTSISLYLLISPHGPGVSRSSLLKFLIQAKLNLYSFRNLPSVPSGCLPVSQVCTLQTFSSTNPSVICAEYRLQDADSTWIYVFAEIPRVCWPYIYLTNSCLLCFLHTPQYTC